MLRGKVPSWYERYSRVLYHIGKRNRTTVALVLNNKHGNKTVNDRFQLSFQALIDMR